MALVTFTSCNSNDDSGNGEITIPGVTFKNVACQRKPWAYINS